MGILASHRHLIQCLYSVHNVIDEVKDACNEYIQNHICDHCRSVNIFRSESSSQHTGFKVTDKTCYGKLSTVYL